MITLAVFLFGVALCLWRAPRGGRSHVILCVFAVALWGGLLLLDPATRNPMFGFTTSTVLWAASRLH
jgi:hypothetical protein